MRLVLLVFSAALFAAPAVACETLDCPSDDPLAVLMQQDRQRQQIEALREQLRQAEQQREDAEMRADFWELDPGGPPDR
jgi:hypothetical protein